MNQDLWVTSGTVSAIARGGNTLYIGGSLGVVGPSSGGGVPLDKASGAPISPFPKVTGYVFAIASDHQGGWYIGGDFTAVGGVPRSSLAHILADGSLSDWAPTQDAHGITALVPAGQTIFVAGDFSTIGGQPRRKIAALDATTAEATPWNPDPSGSIRSYGAGGPQVNALIVRGDTVYAAGNFTSIGGQARNCLAALDAATGLAFDWNPDANDIVNTLTVDASSLYAGGYFTQLGGQPRSLVGAVDRATGSVRSWNPSVTGPADVYISKPYVSALTTNGRAVFVGGRFSSVGGEPRSALASVDPVTGAVTAWDPSPIYHYSYPYPYVWALAVLGDTVFVGGSFDAIGGQEHAYLAAIDAATGFATGWNPRPNEQVWSLCADGRAVYAGGSFRSMGPWQTRHCLAALDLTTGALKDWNPDPNGLEVRALAVSGGTIYAGGDFTFIGGEARSGIAALDTLTGAATAWNPAADGEVRALELRDGTLYVGGGFRHIGGQPRRFAAALDPATGVATGWDPNANYWVYALASSGNTIYLGGFFETMGGESRFGIAAVDAVTGALSPWKADTDGIVGALAVSGETVYAGGLFSTIAGQPRNCVAALDVSTGALRGWDPNLYGSGVANAQPEVHALAIYGHTIYVGGDFYYIGGQARPCLAALDDSVAIATDWTPRANFQVYSLAQSQGTLFAGGSFGSVGLLPTSGLAAISIPEDPVAPPGSFALEQNFPNPARGTTTIRFALPTAATVTLAVYDIQGRRVAEPLDHSLRAPGRHELLIRSNRWKPGVYLYRLEVAGGASATRKFVVLK